MSEENDILHKYVSAIQDPRKGIYNLILKIPERYASRSHMGHYQIGFTSQILPPGGNFRQFFKALGENPIHV